MYKVAISALNMTEIDGIGIEKDHLIVVTVVDLKVDRIVVTEVMTAADGEEIPGIGAGVRLVVGSAIGHQDDHAGKEIFNSSWFGYIDNPENRPHFIDTSMFHNFLYFHFSPRGRPEK